jgi:hypothetical protein
VMAHDPKYDADSQAHVSITHGRILIDDNVPIENQFGLVLTADGVVGQGEAPTPPAQQTAATDNNK